MKKKIIIFRNGSYGDALVALPCLKLIQNENHSSEIFYLTLQNKTTSFFKPSELFKKFGLNFKYEIIFKEKFYIIKFIFFFLKNRFHKMYYLKEDPTNFIFKKKNKFAIKLNILIEFFVFKLLGVKEIIGLDHNNFNSFDNEKESLKLIGRFFKKKIDENNIVKLFSRRKNFRKNSDIILCLGGKFKIKDWGLDNWIKLVRYIINNNKKQKLIIIGNGKIENEKAKIIKSYFPKNCIPYFNKTFTDLINTISNSRLYIGHDTANMHLCALLGLKTISIFSSRDKKGRWFPIGKNNINFYKDFNCTDCRFIDLSKNNNNLDRAPGCKCIGSFRPNLVFNNIKKYF